MGNYHGQHQHHARSYHRGLHHIPPHMHTLVENYIDHGIDGGYFLNLVMDNDFVHAYIHADWENHTHLLGWIRFLYMFAPADCWGTPHAVNLWRQHRGLEGRPAGAQSVARIVTRSS